MIGITGLPCSGKSFAAGMLASGAVDGEERALLKADDIGHEVLLRADVLAALRSRFGDSVAGADPVAARRSIAERVFADPAELAWLEGLVHPLIAQEVARRAGAAGGRAVVEAALLFAAGMDRGCGRVFVIEADFPVRLARAKMRGWNENELRRREERLLPLFAGRDLARVDNSGSAGELRDKLCAALTASPL